MSTYGAMAIWRPLQPTRPAPAAQPHVRLTRRGRLMRSMGLLLTLAVLAVSVINTLGGGTALADTSSPVTVSTTRVTVTHGDSLWQIARAVAPQSDPREVVLDIRALNGMRSDLIHPGQVLLIPDIT